MGNRELVRVNACQLRVRVNLEGLHLGVLVDKGSLMDIPSHVSRGSLVGVVRVISCHFLLNCTGRPMGADKAASELQRVSNLQSSYEHGIGQAAREERFYVRKVPAAHSSPAKLGWHVFCRYSTYITCRWLKSCC